MRIVAHSPQSHLGALAAETILDGRRAAYSGAGIDRVSIGSAKGIESRRRARTNRDRRLDRTVRSSGRGTSGRASAPRGVHCPAQRGCERRYRAHVGKGGLPWGRWRSGPTYSRNQRRACPVSPSSRAVRSATRSRSLPHEPPPCLIALSMTLAPLACRLGARRIYATVVTTTGVQRAAASRAMFTHPRRPTQTPLYQVVQHHGLRTPS